MQEKKLTDEEIVKALDNCVNGDYKTKCKGCPYDEKADYCKVMDRDTLDLIHRLQSENEAQRKIIEYQDGLPDLVEQQKAEIERLTKELQLKTKEFELTEKALIKNVSENIELQKQVDELKERAKIDLANEKNWGKIQTKQAVKDTAKEILEDIGNIRIPNLLDLHKTQDEVKGWILFHWKYIKNSIAECYGVEVE